MAHSPSREFVDPFDGNRWYFHRPDRLRRWKNGVALGAFGLVVGWLLLELALPRRADAVHTHGELANPHAAFDANCEACHRPHSPGEFSLRSVFRAGDRWKTDLTCKQCHGGPAHHEAVEDQTAHEQCASCHHDHQGRDHSLTRISDRHCTKCHDDLAAVHKDGKRNYEPVTNFAKDHPEFRSLKIERALKFSHALHMTPGLAYSRDDKLQWTPAELGKQFGPVAAERYAGNVDAKGSVKLDCQSCHQLDSEHGSDGFKLQSNAIREAPRNAILPARAEGAYYLPIDFDVHCKACHPLRTPPGTSGATVLKEFFVPHRRQPAALESLIGGEYAARLVSKGNPALATLLGPGERLDPDAHPAIRTFGSDAENLTKAALEKLLDGISTSPAPSPSAFRTPGGFACGKCHYGKADKDHTLTEIAELPDRSVWFERAKFNHVSHRAVACASCHPGTEAGFNVNEREPVRIANIATCRACHSPAGTALDPAIGTGTGGGIRHNCTDCHRYHNNDKPRQGLGAPARDPKEPMKLDEFLNGRKN